MRIQYSFLDLIVFCLTTSFFILINVTPSTNDVPEDTRCWHFNTILRSVITRREAEIKVLEMEGVTPETSELQTLKILKDAKPELLTFGWPAAYQIHLIVGNFCILPSCKMVDIKDRHTKVDVFAIGVNAVLCIILSLIVTTCIGRVVDWIRSRVARL